MQCSLLFWPLLWQWCSWFPYHSESIISPNSMHIQGRILWPFLWKNVMQEEREMYMGGTRFHQGEWITNFWAAVSKQETCPLPIIKHYICVAMIVWLVICLMTSRIRDILLTRCLRISVYFLDAKRLSPFPMKSICQRRT